MNIVKNVSAPRVTVYPSDAMIKCDCTSSAVAVSFAYESSDYPNFVTIKKTDSGANAVTITPYSGDTIDGESSYTISLENGYVTLAPTRGGWAAIDSYTITPSYTSPVLTTPKIADGDAGCTITSANQTHASATVTIPNFADAADEFVLKDTAQTLTQKTLTSPAINTPTITSPTISGTGSAVLSKVNPVAATGTLTLSGVVKDGETFTIGTDVYEFTADTAKSLTEGSDFAVDIQAKTTASTGTLTVAVNPTAGDTMTIGVAGATTVYTFRATADFDEAGEIELGSDVAGTQTNIIAAIMGTDGVNTANTDVIIGAFETNVATLTAIVGGTVGDTITTTETFTSESNFFGAGTLGSGADCSAANAEPLIVAAINANDTAGVTASASSASDAVNLVADTAGAAGNAIATTETMANGAFGAATLVGGADFGFITPLFTNMTHEVTVNSHDYESGTTAWTLTAAEQLKPVHKAVSAGGAVDAIIPLTPSIPYTFINGSGQAVTVKGASGTGIEIANAKTATVMADGTNVIRLTTDA